MTVDVTIPLQALVTNSQLHLHAHSKVRGRTSAAVPLAQPSNAIPGTRG